MSRCPPLCEAHAGGRWNPAETGMVGQEDMGLFSRLWSKRAHPLPLQLRVSSWHHSVLIPAHRLPGRFARRGRSAADATGPQSAGGASGTCCCGKGGSLKEAFPHPIHELVFCSVFLSSLLFPSAHTHLIPAPASCPSQPLPRSQPPSQLDHWLPKNPYAQSPCLHTFSSTSALPSWAPSLCFGSLVLSCQPTWPNTNQFPL